MQYIVTEYKAAGRGHIEFCLNDTIRLWLYTKEASLFALQENAILTEEQYQQILHDIIGKRAIKRAMHILEKQERTEHQLREKLLQNGYPKEAIEEAVSYVKRYRYLDDERYARTFIQFHQDSRSRMRIQNDLMRRGISRELIEVSMEEFQADEKEQIRELLEKKHFLQTAGDRNTNRKIYQFLLRKGFRNSDIQAVLRDMGAGQECI